LLEISKTTVEIYNGVSSLAYRGPTQLTIAVDELT
jgi:hypothetical protein